MYKRPTFEQLSQASILEVGDGYRAKNSELGGEGPIFLRSAYLQEHGFVRNMPERFREAGLKRFGSKSAQLGDVVVTTKGNSTGRVGVVHSEQVGTVYSPHLSYWRSKDNSRLDQRFLGFWSQSTEFQSQLAAMAFSTDMAPYLSLRDQRRLHISLPEIGQQRYIGKVLGALDDKIELNRRMNETLEAMAQTIFRDWFVDFGPMRRKIDGVTDPVEIMGGLVTDPSRTRELAELFPASIGDDGLPEGWGTHLFSDISRQHTATVTPTQSPLEQFAHFSLPAFDKGKNPTIELGSGILSNKTVVPLDAVLLSKLNPEIERVWLPVTDAKHRAICSTEFLVYTANGTSTREFLYCLFSDPDFRNILKGLVTGTSKSHQRVAPKALARLLLIRPPLALDKAFGALVGPLLNRALNNGSENRTLAATRDLLLPKLMSGEISLTDARAQAEEVA